RFKKHDKAYERAAERVLTLEEQLKKNDSDSVNVDELQKEIEKLKTKRAAIDEEYNKRNQSNVERTRLTAQIESLVEQIQRQQDLVNRIKSEQIKKHCNEC